MGYHTVTVGPRTQSTLPAFFFGMLDKSKKKLAVETGYEAGDSDKSVPKYTSLSQVEYLCFLLLKVAS